MESLNAEGQEDYGLDTGQSLASSVWITSTDGKIHASEGGPQVKVQSKICKIVLLF